MTARPTRAARATTYGALRDGDRVWIEGYLFTVCQLRIAGRAGDVYGTLGARYTADVIRFEGRCPALAHTGYDGGTYGGYAWRPCLVEGEDA